MSTAKQRRLFDEAIDTIVGVRRGQESTMYGPLRDLFIQVLGYKAGRVHIDRQGKRGRPDITVFADGGIGDTQVPWIVVEAKDERDAVSAPEARAALFLEKAKYITADTAWFVMVDPTKLVARPADRGSDSSADIEISLDAIELDAFAAASAPLLASAAGVPLLLQRFRSGDETMIGTESLSGSGDPIAQTIARDTFFDGLRETTRLLQEVVNRALDSTVAERSAIGEEVAAFEDQFGAITFTAYPVAVHGSPQGREQVVAHSRAAHTLTRRLSRTPALSRLALDALPRFAQRVGLDPADPDDAKRLDRFFSIETANLVLARILLIRFLEDHGFFDEETPDGVRQRRYLCNGGVAAFQGMRAYFGQGYTRLLEDAYRTGASVYAAAFNETELDWVLALDNPELSRTVEWALYRFSRYDFTTIKGDILTGVYDRFLDPSQRKDQGEYYTPPTIARWMLERLGIADEHPILDPACGSGTFLIERYQQTVGEDADRGLADYDEAITAVSRIAGNDINPFSSVLTQIQLLWHLLGFGSAVRDRGLPELHIAERANSLVPTILKDQTTTRFGDIDRDDYAAVVGNPPYIRPERGLDLDPAAREYYTSTRNVDDASFHGVSVDRNVYRLFIYRALDHWCARASQTGKIAFVIPLGFCSGDDASDLRILFKVDARWAITAVVDMELIWRSVFDADVLPMILFAEARPATSDDKVKVYSADSDCVLPPAVKRGRPTFDLNRAAVSEVAYSDLFAPDGRLLTRLTPDRLHIIKKLRQCKTLADAAKPFWTKKRKGGMDVSAIRPTGIGEAKWHEQRLIRYGAARRGKAGAAATGHNLWKGENIRTGGLAGAPDKNVDVKALSTASIWAYPDDVLPQTMFAIPLIEQVPVAAPFDPRTDAMLNTVVVFGPRDDLADFPFDALLASRIYQYYHILNLRASYMNKLRNHIYPTAVAALPWSEDLPRTAADLAAARQTFFDACARRFQAGTSREKEALALGLSPLRDVFKSLAPMGAALLLSESFDSGEPATIGSVGSIEIDGSWRVFPDMTDESVSIDVPTEELAQLIERALRLAEGMEITKSSLLKLPTPPDSSVAEAVEDLISRYQTDALEEAVEREIDNIDKIVGPALGLSDADVTKIQEELATDPFLSRVRPRYPYFTPKQRGRRIRLESSQRYTAAAE